jgi:hypothetical protein
MAQQDRVQPLVLRMSATETHQDGVVPVVLVQHPMVRTQTRTITIALATVELVRQQHFLILMLRAILACLLSTPVVAVAELMPVALPAPQVLVAARARLVQPTHLVPESQTQVLVAVAPATSTPAVNKLVGLVAAVWS